MIIIKKFFMLFTILFSLFFQKYRTCRGIYYENWKLYGVYNTLNFVTYRGFCDNFGSCRGYKTNLGTNRGYCTNFGSCRGY